MPTGAKRSQALDLSAVSIDRWGPIKDPAPFILKLLDWKDQVKLGVGLARLSADYYRGMAELSGQMADMVGKAKAPPGRPM